MAQQCEEGPPSFSAGLATGHLLECHWHWLWPTVGHTAAQRQSFQTPTPVLLVVGVRAGAGGRSWLS